MKNKFAEKMCYAYMALTSIEAILVTLDAYITKCVTIAHTNNKNVEFPPELLEIYLKRIGFCGHKGLVAVVFQLLLRDFNETHDIQQLIGNVVASLKMIPHNPAKTYEDADLLMRAHVLVATNRIYEIISCYIIYHLYLNSNIDLKKDSIDFILDELDKEITGTPFESFKYFIPEQLEIILDDFKKSNQSQSKFIERAIKQFSKCKCRWQRAVLLDGKVIR